MKIALNLLLVLILLSCGNNKREIDIKSVLIYDYREINTSVTTGSLFNEYKKKELDNFVALNKFEIDKFKIFIINAKRKKTFPSKLGREILFGKTNLNSKEIYFAISDFFIFDISNNITSVIDVKDRNELIKLIDYYKQNNK